MSAATGPAFPNMRLTSDEDAALRAWAPSASIPAPPPRPVPGECCGRGCEPCVWDFHARALQIWAQRHDLEAALPTILERVAGA